jgi:undecaprenyl pyrophosphate phosphatase UppP
MANKKTDILIYIIIALIPATLYGLFAYFVIYRVLAGENMLYSYLWNIGAIVLLLVADKYVNDTLLSKEFIITPKNYFFAGLAHTLNFISFRTALYLFYIIVLIFSRVAILSPDLLNEDIQNFVLSVEYCLILLVVFDKFIVYLTNDSDKIQRITRKFHSVTAHVKNRKKRKKYK